MEMLFIALAQGVFKLVMAVAAILAARVTLIWMDHALGVDFFAAMTEASPDEKMRYFSARIIGVCILVGLAIS
jgi:hypothetical protein